MVRPARSRSFAPRLAVYFGQHFGVGVHMLFEVYRRLGKMRNSNFHSLPLRFIERICRGFALGFGQHAEHRFEQPRLAGAADAQV